MSNIEHAFENCMFRYMRTGDLPDIKENDPINAAGMSEEEINAVETCAVYLCFGHTPDQMKAVVYPEDYLDIKGNKI